MIVRLEAICEPEEDDMELRDVIARRRSIRKYSKRRIGQAKVRRLQRALQAAPSGGNRQEYQFIFVTDEEKRRQIAARAGHQEFLFEAPLIVAAVCKPGGEFNVAIAMDHMILTATDQGLGTCWVGWFERGPVRRILGIPRSKAVPILVTVGYAAETPKARPRKPLAELIATDAYRKSPPKRKA
jgi:nitroreductase